MLIKVRSCQFETRAECMLRTQITMFTIEKCNASVYADSLELCLTEGGSNGYFLFEKYSSTVIDKINSISIMLSSII
jgi:hypothetical protein